MLKLVINNHEIVENTISDHIKLIDKKLIIPDKTIIKEPINITLIKDNNEELDFIVGKNSDISILLEIVDDSTTKNNYKINFTAKENSNIKYLLIAALNSSDALLNHKFIVERFANLEIMAGLVSNVLTAKLDVTLNGEGSSVNINSIAASSDDHNQVIDVYMRHNAPNTYGNMNNVGIANKRGRVILNGIEKIEQGMKDSEVFQTLKGIITSDEAIIEVNPILLIEEYDLKAAGHAATVGKLDEEMLFYLQSRGLPRKDAEKLIINGFIKPVIDEIKNDELKEKFVNLVNSRIWFDE